MSEHLPDVKDVREEALEHRLLSDEQEARAEEIAHKLRFAWAQRKGARLIVDLRDRVADLEAELHRRREQAVFYAELAYGRPQTPGRYSIEPHGDGYALYSGRDDMHHGFNLARITETTPDVLKRIEQALNAMPPETTGDGQ